jgi:iron(III) transport system permease protein
MTSLAEQPRGVAARASAPRLPFRLHASTLLCTLALAVVAFLVLYPLWLLLLNSFQVGTAATGTTWGLANWRAAVTEPTLWASAVNTVALAGTRQALALLIGVPIAWLLARTDLPGRHWLEFGFWVAVFLPSLTVVVGWILLFDGYNGLVNKALELLPFVQKGPFDIFSWWGIVFVHLLGATLGIKIMLLAPAFRNMDAALEEAARGAGASLPTLLRRVTVPLLLPAILVATVLGLIYSLESFEIELVLGAPADLDVFSTKIYRLVRQEPPLYGAATALSALMLVLIVPLILVQQWLIHRHGHATVTGRYSSRRYALGRWKWPAFAAVAALVGAMTVLPTAFVLVGSFLKIFGAFEVASPWTLRNWTTALSDAGFASALVNTLVLGVATSLVSMAAFALLAYILVRTRFAARGALDFLTWVPSLLPGIVIGLGILWTFLETPLFRPLYGTMAVLVLAMTLAGMTRSVQVLKAHLVQLGNELEEAAWTSGATWWRTFRRIILPLLAPSVAVVGILAFAAASRTASHVALLATASNRPLALLQLDYLADGKFEAASVVGVVILLLTVGAALLARALGMRLGAGHER